MTRFSSLSVLGTDLTQIPSQDPVAVVVVAVVVVG